MAESTIQLDLHVLLPEVQDDRDTCLDRLESALQSRRGIQRAHLKREDNPVQLCLHYDPNQVSLADVQRMAQRAGAEIANRYHHNVLPVEGMDCSDCALVVEHSLSRLDGVLNVNVNYAAQTMQVEYDSQLISRRAIEKRVAGLGYHVPLGGLRSWFQVNQELLFSLAAGLVLLAGWSGDRFLGFPFVISLGLYVAAYVLAGHKVARHAIAALWARHFDTDLLMLVAALGAAVLGDFAEGALLLFLFSLGHALEHRSLDRARKAIRALADLAPKTALVQREGEERWAPVDAVQLGETAIVRPGVRIPVDGVVVAGQSSVNQAPITGESIPVDIARDDLVYAGSINGEGALQVRATRLARDSTLARVMRMVERAQTQKSPTQQSTEKFTRIFVMIVLVGDLIVILLPLLLGMPFQQSFLMGMTILVAASPCALVLGTPATILTGVAQAARNGVLVKGGAHLENLGRLKAVAFDKTGTITRGQPEVTDVIVFEDGFTDSDVLRLAAAVESRSAHPLAQAVVRRAHENSVRIPEIGTASSITGRGANATVDGSLVSVGSSNLFEVQGIQIPGTVQVKVAALEDQGKTAILVSKDKKIVGLIAVADVLRQDLTDNIAALREIGITRFVMLTGDNPRTAGYIARQAGLSEFRAELMPEDKVTAVKDLVQQYGYIAMVGDGVNDAPALANATVGIAMGGASTDAALEAADVALMADDLSKLSFAVGLGRATGAIIRQNLFISMGVIVGLIGMTLTGLTGIGLAIFFHEGSTLLVALNALRLLRYRPRPVV
ncbi:MAG TPA: cation-translocating P-type ATPase [Anaerolineales bacterium]|nr:cation-translocating P-type ATPase [Anaerolineales bacterium]